MVTVLSSLPGTWTMTRTPGQWLERWGWMTSLDDDLSFFYSGLGLLSFLLSSSSRRNERWRTNGKCCWKEKKKICGKEWTLQVNGGVTERVSVSWSLRGYLLTRGRSLGLDFTTWKSWISAWGVRLGGPVTFPIDDPLLWFEINQRIYKKSQQNSLISVIIVEDKSRPAKEEEKRNSAPALPLDLQGQLINFTPPRNWKQ